MLCGFRCTAPVLVLFFVCGSRAGGGGGGWGGGGPAITGNEVFERFFRVQQNTLEQLIAFLPGIYLFSHYFSPLVAAALGVVYLIGRELYAYTYVKDPSKRDLGFGLTFLPLVILSVGGLFSQYRP